MRFVHGYLGLLVICLLFSFAARDAWSQDKFVQGESALYWTDTGVPLSEAELRDVNYIPGKRFEVLIQAKRGGVETVVGGFEVKGGMLFKKGIALPVDVGLQMRAIIANFFVRGVPYSVADSRKSYRIDRVELDFQRGGVSVPSCSRTFRGVKMPSGADQFCTWYEEQTVALPDIPDGTGNVQYNVRCYISRRSGPFSISVRGLSTGSDPVPSWFRVVSGTTPTPSHQVKANQQDGVFKLFAGAVVGYKISDAQAAGLECKPYRPGVGSTPALRPVENQLTSAGYRTWEVTEDGEFRVASFAKRTVRYNQSPSAGVSVSIFQQNELSGKYELAPDGSVVIENTQMLVRVEVSGCVELNGLDLTVQGEVPQSLSLRDMGGGVYEGAFVLQGDVSGVEFGTATRRFRVSYDGASVGPNARIQWVRKGSEAGILVKSGDEVDCGTRLFVRFDLEAGYQVVPHSVAVRLSGGVTRELAVHDASTHTYWLDGGVESEVLGITCAVDLAPPREIRVVYNPVLELGTLLLKRGMSDEVLVSGGTARVGDKIRVEIAGLRGKVVPKLVRVRYKQEPAFEQTTFSPPSNYKLSFPLTLQDDVEGIDVEYSWVRFLNRTWGTNRIQLTLLDGHVRVGTGSEPASGTILEGAELEMARGTELRVTGLGGAFPDDSRLRLSGCTPNEFPCESLPGDFVVDGETEGSLTLELGKTYYGVVYSQGGEGYFTVRADEATRVRRSLGAPAEDLAMGSEVESGWRLEEGARLSVREVTRVPGKRLTGYSVRMGGEELLVAAGESFALRGAVESIEARYVQVYAVHYEPVGPEYLSLIVQTSEGKPVAPNDFVDVNTELLVRVEAKEGYQCKGIEVNGTYYDYTASGVSVRVERDVALVPKMDVLRIYTLVWHRQSGVEQEVRVGGVLGERVEADMVREGLNEGTRIYVHAKRLGYVYAGLQVNGGAVSDLELQGEWYTFPIMGKVTSLEAVMEAEREPGEGETRVQYTYDHSMIQVYRMEGGVRKPVPNRSIVPHGTELEVKVLRVEEGYRFTCIIANDALVAVDDASGDLYKLQVGEVAQYNMRVVSDKPFGQLPRFVLVRGVETGEGAGGEFTVYVSQGGTKRALKYGERYEIAAGDRFTVLLRPFPGYELARSVFDESGSGVRLGDEGELVFDPPYPGDRLLYVLWASFRPVLRRYELTWSQRGEGRLQVQDLAGASLRSGVELPDQTEVYVEAWAEEGYVFMGLTANGLQLADSQELSGIKVRKRLRVVSPTRVEAVFTPRVLPPSPIPPPRRDSGVVSGVADSFLSTRVYPVPFGDYLMVDGAIGVKACTLYDMWGRALRSYQLEEGAMRHRLDMPGLLRGGYVLVLEGEGGRRRSVRVFRE